MRLSLLLRAVCLVFLFLTPVVSALAADPPSKVYGYDEVEVKPVPRKKIRMSFPGSTRKGGANPQITLRFVVTAQGAVTNLVVVTFSHPDLIEAALDAYADARFTPGRKDGEPVDVRMEVTESYR